MADNDIPETKEDRLIRKASSKRAWTVMEGGIPLLGSGNKFVKTDEMTMAVALAVGNGMPRDRIASRLGISVKTLERHFEVELAEGKEYLQEACDGTAMVGLFKARYDPRYIQLAKMTMAKHGGYSDKVQQDNISTDGSMGARTPIIVVPDCSTAPAVATKADKKAAKPKVKPKSRAKPAQTSKK